MIENTPFWHALELAWCGDGALSLHSIRLLDAMQKMIGLTDEQRAEIESRFEEEVVYDLTRAGFGCGDQALAAWVGTLTFLDDPAAQDVSRALGKAAMLHGLSRERWNWSYSWMKQLGLERPFAEGVWLEGEEAGELARVPALLVPVAQKIGLIENE
ncbi:MAG: hypothetical protein CMO20_03150 [Thermoplasmata archaeon]|nr:hypothetical protein [Thermoplasmata archaeon]|tara:strand:- start:7643 stop:8113 length:471 start_codon:yes stop_codon:yes gene_type:complete